MKNKTLILTTVFTAMCLMADSAVSAILFAHNGYDGSNGDLYAIDTITKTVTVLSNEADRSGPEVQISPDGSVIYMATISPATLRSLDAVSGLTTGTVAFSNFPLQPGEESYTSAVTAMEFVGGVLYGSAHRSGPESNPGVLVTINTETGGLTAVGTMTGMNRPTGGMHYLDGVMYAISATDNGPNATLYTIDLNTGESTVVAPITLSAEQQNSTSGLTHADGKMYLVMTGDTNLYSLNLTTGELALEFDLGVEVNSLTTAGDREIAPVPSLSQWGIIMLGLLMFGFAYAGLRRRL